MLRASLVLTLLGFVISGPAMAGPVELLRELRREPARKTAEGHLAQAGLDAASLALVLPDGRAVVAQRTHLERGANSATWSGEVVDAPDSRVSLTSHRGTVTGVVSLDGRTFELRPAASGRHVFEEIDTAGLPPLEPSFVPPPTQAKSDPLPFRALGYASAASVPVTHDVLILYTAASARRYGGATLQSMIVGGVAATNEAYRQSGVGITLRLVGLQQAATIAESRSGMVETLASLGRSEEASKLRDRYAADIVLLVNESDDWCGYAYIMHEPVPAYASQAFGAVQARCLSSESIAHEIGHIQGLMHDRDTRDEDGALPYGHGFRVCERGGFRDVMSYRCPHVEVPRVRLFSNPDRAYRGVPTGIAHESDPERSADAARALNETAALVAGYRDAAPVTGAPRAPVDLTASGRRGVVRLGWRALDWSGSGFAVERSSGGEFVEIARLDAGVTRFLDTTVMRRATYAYRVRALGTDGASSASSAVTVSIRDGGARLRDLDRHGSSPYARASRR